ncbi:MAG TPA: hypothetical protein VMS56_03335 [Thermoanaerobaculia bacterium]|nr:hypothetical protein [Thermoanaerobaculia bacterium]
MIFASPVDAPGSAGLFHFEVGLAATAVEVDEQASFWIKSVSDDILVDGRLLVPRLIVSKGLGFASVAASYGRVGETDGHVLGGSVDLPLIRGGLARPTVAIRGVFSELVDVEEADLRSYGALVMIGKGFGPITPYAGWGRMWAEGEARIDPPGLDPILLSSDLEREVLLVGAKLDLALIKLVLEGLEGEQWRYAARVAIGF